MNIQDLLLDPRRRRHWRLLLALLLAVVSWFAFRPGPTPDSIQQLDKLRHVWAFSTLAFVASLGGNPSLGHAGRVAVGLMAYGLAIELIQSQLPSRTASVADLLADAAGVAIGLLLVLAVRRLPTSR
jgi:VanZ family protein